METVLANLAAGAPPGAQAPPLLAGTGADQMHLLIVCTGERGLCGAFNTSIVRLARERANALAAEGKTVKILCVGKKGYDQLRRTHEKAIIGQIDLRGGAHGDLRHRAADRQARARDVRGRRVRRLHPVLRPLQVGGHADPDRPAAHSRRARRARGDRRRSTDYEPDEGEILAQLLPRAVTVRIYRALLENVASFFGAQMSAMDNATRNAGEMVKKYTLRYNRTRQAMITKELIEIISGAEAL